jgi:hypothetical protein
MRNIQKLEAKAGKRRIFQAYAHRISKTSSTSFTPPGVEGKAEIMVR